MLTIRLHRGGKKNKPEYKVVLAQKTAAAQKKFVEILGNYNPHSKALTIKDEARLKYWIDEQHVEVSATAHNLFVTNKLVSDKKVKAFTLPKKEVEETATEEAPVVAEAPSKETVAEEVATPAPAEAVSETTATEEVVAEAPAPEPAPAETPVEAPTEQPVEETPAPEVKEEPAA